MTYDSSNGIFVGERRVLRVQLPLPYLPQNLTRDAKVAVIADGGILFVESLSDGAAFGISFIITKFDGLIRWSKLTLARQKADEFGEF